MRRYKIFLRAEKNGGISFSYNLHIYSALLNLFPEDTAKRLHSSKKPIINFSRLIGPMKFEKSGIKIRRGAILTLHLSTLEENLEKELPHSIGKTLWIKNLPLSILSLEFEPYERSSTFNTLSWVVVKKEGKFLKPTDKEYLEELEKNAERKTGERVKMEILSTSKEKRIKIKNTYVVCFDLQLRISASEKAKEILFHTGIGEKNKLGFGMLGIMK